MKIKKSITIDEELLDYLMKYDNNLSKSINQKIELYKIYDLMMSRLKGELESNSPKIEVIQYIIDNANDKIDIVSRLT